MPFEEVLISYVKKRTWEGLNRRTINGKYPNWSRGNKSYLEGGVELQMSKQEFYSWCDTQASVILHIYRTGGRVSLDRTGKHYSIQTIQFLDLHENLKKCGSVTAVAVRGTNLLTGEIKEYPSARATAKDGFNPDNIRMCLSGKVKSHLGYKWERINKLPPTQN